MKATNHSYNYNTWSKFELKVVGCVHDGGLIFKWPLQETTLNAIPFILHMDIYVYLIFMECAPKILAAHLPFATLSHSAPMTQLLHGAVFEEVDGIISYM